MKAINNRLVRILVLIVSLIMSLPFFGQNADAVDLNINGYSLEEPGTREEGPQYPENYGPLINTRWDQGHVAYPDYNKYCPWYDGKKQRYRAATGCSATALAQILYYYNIVDYSTEQTAALIAPAEGKTPLCLLSSANKPVEIDGNSHTFKTYEWDYALADETELAARIMFGCGLNINSKYMISDPITDLDTQTGANDDDVLNSLISNYGFFKAELKYKRNYTDDEWCILLKDYISNDIPLYYFGEKTENGEKTAHAYIIDGYRTNNDGVTEFRHNLGDGNYPCYSLLNNYYTDNQGFISPVSPHDEFKHYNHAMDFGYRYSINIYEKDYIIEMGETYSVSKTNQYYKITYNKPGLYSLFDRRNSKQIQITVYVRDKNIPQLEVTDEVCRGQLYEGDFRSADFFYHFEIAETDYNEPRKFVQYKYRAGHIAEECVLTLKTKRCKECESDVSCLNSNSKETNNQIIYESITKYYDYMDAMIDFVPRVLMEAYSDDDERCFAFWNLFQSLIDSNTGMISEEGIQELIGQNQLDSIPHGFIRTIAERYNQSVMYWNEGYYSNDSLPEGYGSMIEYDTAAMRKAYEAQAYAESLGFSDVRQMYDNAYEMLESEIENQQTSVCARVTVQFTQKMTMTREAFNGTLQIFNGHESIPMQNILVDFRIKDSQGNDCTNLFQINTLSLDQITGISGDGSLAAQTIGTALVQFIPTRNAAPTQPVVYSFGGSFSFIDPFTGEGLTYPLYPVEITVNPSPDLHVKYFMPRDILGDNALTEDRVEPSVPAELGVIISNKGAGTAKNVTLETAEPEIIDNEKGLAINFTMSGASFNGSPRQLGLTEVPFGDIESGQTAVGEWLFTSPLLGHFVSYDAHVVHNSSYGNQDLSLVSHLDIHELIHPIFAYGNLDDGINDFLVNDNPDAYDTPDSIYFSHGGKTSVSLAESLAFDHFVSPENTVVTLTLNPSAIGWNYGETDDPGMNQYQIVSCVRNHDNQEIPLNNVWLTYVTMPDGGDPVYENKLHIIDTVPDNQAVSYTLEFAPKPSNLRIFNGNVDAYWSNPDNWEGNVMPLEDDEVLINGICQLDTDATVFSLTVSKNQSLTIPDGRSLTVSGDLASEVASRLVIEEGGQLRHGSTGVRATVQKTILPYTEGERDGWYLITSPLVGATEVTSIVNLLSNNYDLYYYDEPSAYWMNQENTANGFTHLANGTGYLYANSEETLLAFPGEIRNGSSSLSVLLNYTEGLALKGFNLVGNPFVYNLTSYATVNVANGCYQINEDKSDFIVNEISEENPLKPTEAFFVKAIDEDASVTFNSGRNAKSNEGGSLSLEISYEGKLLDRLIVKKDGASLEKLSMNERRTKIYAKQNQQEFAIVPIEGNEQFVSFKAVKNGTYMIATHTENMKFDYLHLIDNLTGSDVDLLNTPNYTFKATTSDYASRFKLVFVLGVDDGSESEDFGFFYDNKFHIYDVEGEATFQVVDLMGRVLFSENFTGNYSKQLDYPAAVYIMRLINNKEVKNQKAVVR